MQTLISKFVVGLTGGIGSGKSAASNLFAARDIVVVDADVVAREVVAPGKSALDAIRRHLGDGILLADGSLNRAALREIIFSQTSESQASQKMWLEQLLHPLIREEIKTQLSTADSAYVILASPLLLETDQNQLCQRILLIDVPETIQIDRACARDGNSTEQIRAIIAAQGTREFKQSSADDIIDNSKNLEYLDKQVEEYHQRYLDMANQYDRDHAH
jgi:dephospho-CoA kinase